MSLLIELIALVVIKCGGGGGEGRGVLPLLVKLYCVLFCSPAVL